MRREERFANIHGKNICYWDCGDIDKPSILLGHSFLWSKHMWQPQITALAEHYRLIIPDLWSHGASEGLPDDVNSLADMAECYFQLMQQLGLNRFSIIGLSVGGMWGAELALAHPEAVTSLVMMDTFVGPEPDATQKQYLGLIEKLRNEGFNQQMIEILWPFFFSTKTQYSQPSIIEAYKTFLASIKPHQLDGIANIGTIIFTRPNLLERLAELSMPTLIVVGKDDGPRPPKEAHIMAEHAKCEVIEINDGGHICNVEQIKQVNTCLQGFLAKQR